MSNGADPEKIKKQTTLLLESIQKEFDEKKAKFVMERVDPVKISTVAIDIIWNTANYYILKICPFVANDLDRMVELTNRFTDILIEQNELASEAYQEAIVQIFNEQHKQQPDDKEEEEEL